MILSISEHIYKTLRADSAVTDIVGNKMYPIGAKNEVQAPFLVYTRDSVDVGYDKAGRKYADVRATVSCVAGSNDQALALAEAVIAALDKKIAVYNGFTVLDAIFTDATEGYSDDVFIQEVTFKFTISE